MSIPGSLPVQTEASSGKPEGRRSIIVETSLFPTEIIMRTAHRFSGEFHVTIQAVGDGLVEVRFKPKGGKHGEGVEDDFKNELLDESLRAVVARESRLERDLILAHALSRHPVLHAEYESAAAFSDPHDLLTPDQK